MLTGYISEEALQALEALEDLEGRAWRYPFPRPLQAELSDHPFRTSFGVWRTFFKLPAAQALESSITFSDHNRNVAGHLAVELEGRGPAAGADADRQVCLSKG